jgi:5-methylthioadenosine/S-adenosylhomocysteine deaminase
MRKSHGFKIILMVLTLLLWGCTIASEQGFETSTPPALASATKILVQNAALVITMDPELGEGPLGIIQEGGVLIVGDSIVAVGKGLESADAAILDATGKIVLPGFVDVHNHLWQSVIRGCGGDKDLLGWLKECVFPLYNGNITREDAYAAVRLSTLGLIATGVTMVVDVSHSFTPEFVMGNIRALKDSGLRFVFAYCGAKERFDDLKGVKNELIDTNPRAGFQVCSHPSLALLGRLTDASQLAKELDVPLNLHLNENIKQREDEPFKAIELSGALYGKLVVNHAIHLTEEEIASLAKHNVKVAHNPLSNMRLASGIMHLPEMHGAGMEIGLGLDGGTNDTSDMFANMKAAVGLQRARLLRTDIFPTVEDVLRMATMGGAEVLDMEDTIGSLTPGKKADLIILDPGGINFAPRWDWVTQIVFNGQPTNVEYVFVDGKPLKAEGKILGVSLAEVVQAAEDAAKRIRKALEKQKNNGLPQEQIRY